MTSIEGQSWNVADHSRCRGNLIDVNELGKSGDDNK